MTGRVAENGDEREVRLNAELARREPIWRRNTLSDGSTIVVIRSGFWLIWPLFVGAFGWWLGTIAVSGTDRMSVRVVALAGLVLATALFSRLGIHCRVLITPDGISMVDFVGRRVLRWGEVEGVSASYYGLTIRCASGSSETARFVAAKSNLSRMIGGKSESDRIANWISELALLQPDNRMARLKAGAP
jgi:hypothetical protein